MIAVPDLFIPFGRLLEIIIVVLAVGLLALAAYGDAKNRRIPNALTAAIAIMGIFRLVAIDDPIGAVGTVVTAFLVLVITFLLFCRGFMGGGDVKLLTATVLLIGYHQLYPFLAIMSICGALVSIAVLLAHRFVTTVSRPSVPYGVAIAVGAIVVLSLKSSIIG